jgi:hypothetical protein
VFIEDVDEPRARYGSSLKPAQRQRQIPPSKK